MKKRLLALALCLVMMTSLLPLTAAAVPKFAIDSIKLTADSLGLDADTWKANNLTAHFTCKGPSPSSLSYNLNPVLYDDNNGLIYLSCYISPVNWEFDDKSPIPKLTFSVPGYTSELIKTNLVPRYTPNLLLVDFILTKHVHNWQSTQTENSVTATCLIEGCPIGSASLTLDAHSVTLPDSPFNAQVLLKGITEQQIKEEFCYTIGPICYKFKAPGDSNFTDITPADGAKEGTYQAAVTLSPRAVAALYARNDDGTNQGPITLYTEYTAVNPEVTAQTGDNRPIEIMMASALVFSALAAAAFIVDNKRKYSR